MVHIAQYKILYLDGTMDKNSLETILLRECSKVRV